MAFRLTQRSNKEALSSWNGGGGGGGGGRSGGGGDDDDTSNDENAFRALCVHTPPLWGWQLARVAAR